MKYSVTVDHKVIAKFVMASDAEIFAEALTVIVGKPVLIETKNTTVKVGY